MGKSKKNGNGKEDNQQEPSLISNGATENNPQHQISEVNETENKTAEEKAAAEKALFDKHVSNAVQEALQAQLASFFANFNSYNTQPKFTQPTFQMPNYSKEEKLQGSSNFQAWRSKLETGLQSQNLLIYIQREEGELAIPEEVRRTRDAQALQYLNATVSNEISMSLLRCKSAYSAYKTIAITYGDQKLAENLRLERRQRRLIFRPWHDVIRFMNEFESIIADYKAIGTEFEDELLIAKFLAMIDIDSGAAENPYLVFYNIVQTLPKEFRTFETVKNRFLNFTPKSKMKKPESYDKKKKDDHKQQPKQEKQYQKRPYNSTSGDTVVPAKKDRKTVSDLVNGKHRVSMEDLYSLEQHSRLSKMTSAEKYTNRCSTCNVYFHQLDSCPYKTKLCMNCYHFGHNHSECKLGKNINTKGVGSSLTNTCDDYMVYDLHKTDIVDKFDTELNFIVDSGATHHAVSDLNLIHNYKTYSIPKTIKLAINAETSCSLGYSLLPILLKFQNSCHILKLHNVQFVNDLEDPTLSVQAFNNQFNTTITLNTNSGLISYRKKDQEEIISLIQTNELYTLTTRTTNDSNFINTYSNNNVYYTDSCTDSYNVINTNFIKISKTQ